MLAQEGELRVIFANINRNSASVYEKEDEYYQSTSITHPSTNLDNVDINLGVLRNLGQRICTSASFLPTQPKCGSDARGRCLQTSPWCPFSNKCPIGFVPSDGFYECLFMKKACCKRSAGIGKSKWYKGQGWFNLNLTVWDVMSFSLYIKVY